ncbi:MAG TPA: hypothetical protein VL172_02695, partial [Kofleriaceae bacterium]|nr:hypothetical protein [Kofleriaceae bacterium]
GAAALEKALAAAERWDELDRLWRHRASIIDDPGERRRLLERRARLYEDKLPDAGKLKEVLAELAAGAPPGNPWSQRLREAYRRDQEWAKLVRLIEAETPPLEQARGPEEREAVIAELLELATIQREHLSDRDHAAEMLHKVLSVDPTHPEALSRYADHFKERRDWRGLADLLEFGFDNARAAGAPAAELIRQLEEMAQVAELRLGDTDRAIGNWNRVLEIDADNAKAREAIRRLASRAKMWQSLVGVLEQEAQAAPSPRDRAEALRRIAQVYRERQVNPRRAISLYEEVIQLLPDDGPALKAVADLYEREGDEAGLAHTLRRQLDLDVRAMNDDLEKQGKRLPTAREWPVAKRVERLTALRRLASMYEQRLADVEGVVYACGGILEILPGDRDALDRMERVLEKAGDQQRLEQTLEYHAAAATGPAEKAKVLRRLARLAQDRDDEPVAMERFEQVIKATPADAEALAALADLYERHQRWGELAQVLERSLLAGARPGAAAPAAPGADGARAADLLRYARVVDARLGDAARAVRAWRSVLEVLPNEREALDALARLYEGAQRWRELADVLALQQPLYRADEPDTAAAIALQRARLLEERLGAPAEAARVLESILSDIDPSNLDAHQALRRLCEGRGDFEAAVRIAERELYLTEEPHHKIVRGLEIGIMVRDRLADPARALQAFERVLEIEPEHEEALAAAAELYAKVGDWPSHIRALERRIEMAAEGRDRRALMMKVAQVTADRIGDHKTAFRWWRRAHEHAPDATTIAELRRAAETYGLWRELAEVYEHERQVLLGERGVPVDRAAYVSACRELARLAEQRLSDRKRALTALHDAIKVSPRDDGLLAEAERIATEADQKPLWNLFLDCLEEPLRIADAAAVVGLRRRRAQVLEERMGAAAAAAAELLEAFACAPERDETRQALYELAGRAGNWHDVIAVESALLARARAVPERVEVLRRKAQVLEDKVDARARAFRCHLEALLIDPEDADTSAHLWRLARAIGTYAEADRTAQPEPAPARIDQQPARVATMAAAAPPAAAPLVVRSSPGRRDRSEASLFREVLDPKTDPNLRAAAARAGIDQTSEIDISELEPADGDDDDELDDVDPQLPAPGELIAATRRSHRADPTMELRAEDLIAIVPKKTSHRADPTMELRPEDLMEALGARQPPSAPPRQPEPPPRGKGPPPPPPRAPQIARRPGAAGTAPVRAQAPAAGPRGGGLPGVAPVTAPQ